MIFFYLFRQTFFWISPLLPSQQHSTGKNTFSLYDYEVVKVLNCKYESLREQWIQDVSFMFYVIVIENQGKEHGDDGCIMKTNDSA